MVSVVVSRNTKSTAQTATQRWLEHVPASDGLVAVGQCVSRIITMSTCRDTSLLEAGSSKVSIAGLSTMGTVGVFGLEETMSLLEQNFPISA